MRISGPRPLQQPFPKFYLGGGSRQAWELSAKHSDVHLFWGDLPEKIASNIAEIRQMARAHGRENDIGFGMRLQVICRENETRKRGEHRSAGAPRYRAAEAGNEDLYNKSEANLRVQQLAREHGDLLLPHLWTGITKVRRAPASPSSAIPRNAPTRCSNSSMPAAIRSAYPATSMTRRPNVSAG